MPLQRGSDWTDWLDNLLPILIAVIVGGFALLKRAIDAFFARRSEETRAKPKPPLDQEVKRYLDMLDRDTRVAPGEEAAAEAEAEAEKAREVEIVPRPEPEPVFASPPDFGDGLPERPSRAETSAPMAVAPAIQVTSRSRRRAPGRPPAPRRKSLREAVLWSEILAPPVALRPPRP